MLHIAVFPWLAFGHMLPFFQLSKRLAERGHKISFISTPNNIQRLPKIPPHLSSNFSYVSLPLTHLEHLPQDAEATSDLSPHQIPLLKLAFDGLQVSLSQFLHTSSPDWIIYDFAPYWLPPIAAKLNISCAFFSILRASSSTYFGSAKTNFEFENNPKTRPKPEDLTVPPPWVTFPSKVAFKIHEAKRLCEHFDQNESGVSDVFRYSSVIEGCDVFCIRSCGELEPEYLSLLAEINDKPVLPVGLLPPEEVQEDNGDAWITIRQFLDKQEKGSTVFIAFGSELTLSGEEVSELALGLELSGLPFIWALRKRQEFNFPELPEGFEERVKGRGLVWTGWAPQGKIMAHESVGGFMTHCGASSVIEAICFGLPMIMMPFEIDQGLNARFFEEKKVGIEVARNEEDGSFTRESVAETVRLVVAEKEGKIYRENGKKMMSLFTDKELQNGYIDRFVQFLQNHKR